jgi:hypothetical protein
MQSLAPIGAGARSANFRRNRAWPLNTALAALASPSATKALDPDPFPCRSLRHAAVNCSCRNEGTRIIAIEHHNRRFDPGDLPRSGAIAAIDQSALLVDNNGVKKSVRFDVSGEQLFPGDISEGVAVNADVGARLPAVRTAASTAGFRFSRHCCNSPGCCHRGGLFPGCAAVGGGPPLPWTFAGGFSTCCISRLPPKCWPGVQQCVELVCDTPHMVYLGQCKRFCNPFIAAARQTDAQWLRAPVR